MPSKTELLRRANRVLAELDSIFPGENAHQKFMWWWSGDLVNLVPWYDADGNPTYQYVCPCGVDRNIHSPDCSQLARAKMRMVRISSLGTAYEDPKYHRAWILARWKAPPPFSAWVDMMGSEDDYPANGRYIPVSAGSVFVYLPADKVPTEADSQVIVRKLKEHAAEWRAEHDAEMDKINRRDIPEFDKRGNLIFDSTTDPHYTKVRDRLKDVMTFNGHVPGKKDNTLFISNTTKEEIP